MSVLTRQSYYGCSKTGVPTTWMREETRDVIMAHKERFVDVLNENKLQTNMVISSVTRNYFLKVSRFNFFSEMLKKNARRNKVCDISLCVTHIYQFKIRSHSTLINSQKPPFFLWRRFRPNCHVFHWNHETKYKKMFCWFP